MTKPGPIVLFGSGEVAPTAQPVYDRVMCDLRPPVRVGILETPAGFQLNSADVASTVGAFIEAHLPNHRPRVTVIPARKRGTAHSPDNPAIVEPIYESELLFMGPGSPTYAARQLAGSLAWQVLRTRHLLGYPLVMASAATIAISAHALPVYEIYKVGEDLHWATGLDLLAPFGLDLVFVPHWNNNEGGAKHDTSRCYMGEPRFAELLDMLPADQMVVGIDEHTALILDLAAGQAHVVGRGLVTLRCRGEVTCETPGSFSLDELGPWRLPHKPAELIGEMGIADDVWQRALAAQAEAEAKPEPTAEVHALVARRQAAREARDWATSDALRDRLAALGWLVRDTPTGPEIEWQESESRTPWRAE